ncbi:hypothetical protein [Lutibacter sp.]
MIQSPFYNLSKKAEKKLTVILSIFIVVLIFIMHYIDTKIQNGVTTNGIISFELAKDLSKSISILNSWNILSKISAGISLGVDFLFLIIYSLFISLIIHKLNEKLWKYKKMYTLGIVLIWCMFLAAFFDIIENLALIKLLLGNLKQLWSSLSYYFAIVKFSLLAFGILYIIVNLLFIIFKKIVGKFS